MLVNNMTLRQMIDYKPDDGDMAILPLEVTVLVKLTIISPQKEENYDFIRFFFPREDTRELFYDLGKTSFYDFDAREVKNSHKFITIAELYGKDKAPVLGTSLRDILTEYQGDADLIFDLFTFDNKFYRISVLEGVLKAEEVKEA
ncbi:MAG: hypothetical protein IKE21_09690 [Erysipelotrichaceae bacterium]|nr:hypothetical protein [Erysipelotrichaceae bacterium]